MAKISKRAKVGMGATNMSTVKESASSQKEKGDEIIAGNTTDSNLIDPSPTQLVSWISKVNPQTLLLLVIGYILIKPELSGMCI